ncbi:c-type cytochrome [bacterium]|nr:c-type cytochrome [bacterium]
MFGMPNLSGKRGDHEVEGYRMRPWLWVLIGVLVLIILVIGGTALYVQGKASALTNARFDVEVEPFDVPMDSATIARGEHIVRIRGCMECHGTDLAGRVFMDAGPVGMFAGSNLTGGKGGIGKGYRVEDWVRAVRHAVGPGGRPLIFMPSEDYRFVDDEDMAAMIAYIRSVPPVDNQPPPPEPGPIAKALYAFGDWPQLMAAEVVDHEAEVPPAPEPGPTKDYGAYLSTTCIGCHGTNLSGGKMPGQPPGVPNPTNLTPHPDATISSYEFSDFQTLMREGKRPDGSEINPFMPTGQFKHMTDTELQALWAYISSREPVETGSR